MDITHEEKVELLKKRLCNGKGDLDLDKLAKYLLDLEWEISQKKDDTRGWGTSLL